MTKNPGSGRRMKTVQTAFQLIETIQMADGITLTELANAHGASKSTVYNHLKTLEELGYVYNVDNEYFIGLGFLTLGKTALDRLDLPDLVEPEAGDLATRIDGRVVVMVEQGGLGFCAYQQSADEAVMTNTVVGETIPLHCTALGKAYLSALPERDREHILERLDLQKMTDRTITSVATLREELDETAQRGYSINDEERIRGMRAIGAPITTDRGTVLGSISASLPITRMKGELFDETVPELVTETANVIAVKQQYRGTDR